MKEHKLAFMKRREQVAYIGNNEETSFEDMLAMLRKKVQEKDDEIKRLQEEKQKNSELEKKLHTTEQKLFEVFFDKETVNA